MRRPVGVVRLSLHRKGRLLWTLEEENLFVNSGLPALAALVAGDGTNQFISAIGFGSNGTAPSLSDTALTAPAYYKTLDSHTENGSSPGLGSVRFNWSLTTAATISSTWAADTAYALGATVAPGNGYWYQCTTAGTSGSSEPRFGAVVAGTTADGSVVWTNEGADDSGAVGTVIQELGLLANQASVTLPGTTAPAPLLARKTISPITFTSGMNLSGTWTLTF